MSDRFARVRSPSRRFLRRTGDRHPPEASPELSMDPRADATAAPVEQSVVSSAIYLQGHRLESPPTLAETYQQLREQPNTMAWIGLYRPRNRNWSPWRRKFGLHELAVEDAIVAHQRPKLERTCATSTKQGPRWCGAPGRMG